MSEPRHASPGLAALGGGLAVAAVLVVLARWLPLEFTYQPNDLGIVSPTTEARYPTQQETILFLGFGAAGVLGVWIASGVLGARRFALGSLAAFEGTALASLAASLLLPRAAATAIVALASAGLVGWVARARRAAPAPADAATAHEAGDSTAHEVGAASSTPRAAPWLLGAGIVALAVVRVPRLLQALHALASGATDLDLARNDWVFLSEDGQHLAWADALLRGGLHGRDFFCLYGPLYDWSVVWIWELVGRSVAGWHLHVGVTEALAWTAFLSLAAGMLRRRWLLLPLALLTPHLMLRIGLAFASLAFLFRHGRTGRPAHALAAGVLAGLALLYSQEFGLAAVLAAAAMLGLPPAGRALGLYGAGLAVTVAPMLAWYAAAGALEPMLADLAGYPALLLAGFGNVPFPSLRASLPWAPGLRPGAEVVLFYALPAVLVVALGTQLPRRAPHPRSPVLWVRQLVGDWAASPRRREAAVLALFGLVAFRSALGRSDTLHLYAVAAPALLLLAVGADRLLDRWREDAARLQLALGALLLWPAGIVPELGAAGLFHLRNTAVAVRWMAEGELDARGSGAIARVVRWLEANSEPDDRFYFLPNEAALYYLTDRPAPTRFVVAHQMVTDAHRAEALGDLRAAPPRYVVWNDASLELDGFEDAVLLGPELWAWLHEHYAPRERLGGMRIWEWRGDGPAPDEPGDAEPENGEYAEPENGGDAEPENATPERVEDAMR